METERPDLTGVPAPVIAYIEALEARLTATRRQPTADTGGAEADPSEPPTTIQVVTASAAGLAKRTPRHLYGRQRRGGMGVFDVQLPEEDPPWLLTLAPADAPILLVTNHGRIFKRIQAQIAASDEVRARGQLVGGGLPFRPGEHLVALAPAPAEGYVILASERGWVRRIHANYVGRSMIDGTSFHDIKEGGYLVGATTSPGDRHLLMATRSGQGIRFREVQVPARGCLGLRVAPDDRVAGVAAVAAGGAVFVVTADGKGTTRLMRGFRENKAPGAGGKALIKASAVIGVTAVDEADDLFLLSRQSKIIRFAAADVPAKEGVVQGVNCFALRVDEVVAVARARLQANALQKHGETA